MGRARHQIRVGWAKGLEDAQRRGQLENETVVVTALEHGKDGHWEHYGPSTNIQAHWMAEVNENVNHMAREHAQPPGDWPSTPFLALCVALAVAQHTGAAVSVFGFGKCLGCNRYDDCDGSNATDKSSFTEERKGLNGTIRLFAKIVCV